MGLETQSLNDDILRQNKQMKRLKSQNEEYEQEIESIEKEKRKIKSALNEKDGQITILSHKLELIQQRKELESVPTNDQITKLKQSNQELEEEKEQMIGLKVQINQEQASTENAEKIKQIECNKY